MQEMSKDMRRAGVVTELVGDIDPKTGAAILEL
jgi:hypothetical protein